MLSGQNGILNRAVEAKEKTEISSEKENISLALTLCKMDKEEKTIDKNSLEKALKSQIGKNEEVKITSNGNDSFVIEFTKMGKVYYIEGTGEIVEESEVTKIETINDLKEFRDEVNSGNSFKNKIVSLKNDIVIDEKWIPIGNETNKFEGTFIGNNHTINININSNENNIGLFGVNSGNIYSLGILGEIIGNEFVGGLVGKNYGNIFNSYNEANIKSISTSSNPYVGGIAGKSFSGIINTSYNKGVIQSNYFSTGGITGGTENTTVKNCYNLGTVSGNGQVGGIVGRIINSYVYNCYNVGVIRSSNSSTGGIVGQDVNNSYISNCINVGEIYGISNTGGIIGGLNGKIEKCYNTGKVIGNGTTGGIVGFAINNSLISNCYNKAEIQGKTEEKPEASVGGIVGSSDIGIIGCLWYSDNIEYAIGNLKETDGFSSDLVIPEILEIVNSENKFKESNDGKYPILEWQ